MDFDQAFDPDAFADDLEQIREYGGEKRYPLPRVVGIFQDGSASGATVEWAGKLYDLISDGPEPYDEVAILTHAPSGQPRQTVIANNEVNKALLPFPQAEVAQVIAWRIYYGLHVAAHTLLDTHAEQVVAGLNELIESGFAPLGDPPAGDDSR